MLDLFLAYSLLKGVRLDAQNLVGDTDHPQSGPGGVASVSSEQVAGDAADSGVPTSHK